eukprot:comp21755_c0_seq1/m.48620 comp21755_c0_seq1/g.48620  ORF comp21755_c0_seq1/g.48620 comp21755_c0_seq1/m.48620 type:complete len:815 (+) comp21755_c0_seq1:133-2577(+)
MSAFGRPNRSIVVDGEISESCVKKATFSLIRTYSTCDSGFCFDRRVVPRRLLTTLDDVPCGSVGQDNSEGDLIVHVGEILGGYEIVDVLGKGAFGQVFSGLGENGRLVAIKVIKNRPIYFAQSQMERRILHIINRINQVDTKKHIVELIDSFIHLDHQCLVFEQLSYSLLDLLKLNHYNGLSLNLVRMFGKQIIESLIILHSIGIIHCDIKPENILLTNPKQAHIKLIDFGSAAITSSELLFTYVQSRFYRAPEVILGLDYGCQVDMWSVGCVLAELFFGIPLFPGENSLSQITRITEFVGVPDRHMINSAKLGHTFFKLTNDEQTSVTASTANNNITQPKIGQASGGSAYLNVYANTIPFRTTPNYARPSVSSPIAGALAGQQPPVSTDSPPAVHSTSSAGFLLGKTGGASSTAPPISTGTPNGNQAGIEREGSTLPRCTSISDSLDDKIDIKYRIKTREEYAADTKESTVLPPFKRYFRYTTLEENIFNYPFPAALRTEADIAAERHKRQLFLHFLRGLFELDPKRRWTAEVAINHPFFSDSGIDLTDPIAMRDALDAFSDAASKYLAANASRRPIAADTSNTAAGTPMQSSTFSLSQVGTSAAAAGNTASNSSGSGGSGSPAGPLPSHAPPSKSHSSASLATTSSSSLHLAPQQSSTAEYAVSTTASLQPPPSQPPPAYQQQYSAPPVTITVVVPSSAFYSSRSAARHDGPADNDNEDEKPAMRQYDSGVSGFTVPVSVAPSTPEIGTNDPAAAPSDSSDPMWSPVTAVAVNDGSIPASSGSPHASTNVCILSNLPSLPAHPSPPSVKSEG